MIARCDISIVINAHDEGRMADAALQSAARARIAAEAAGVVCQTLLVLDRPARETLAACKPGSRLGVDVLEVDYGDLGASRNHGVSAASGELVAFLDADDLWCTNWLAGTWASYRASSYPAAFHPEWWVEFGENYGLFRPPDWRDPDFDARGLILQNYWTALVAAPRSILLAHPYPVNSCESRFGYEDWAWNMETLAHGVRHEAVPDTFHFIRKRRTSSLSKESLAQGRLRFPTPAFAAMLAADHRDR